MIEEHLTWFTWNWTNLNGNSFGGTHQVPFDKLWGCSFSAFANLKKKNKTQQEISTFTFSFKYVFNINQYYLVVLKKKQTLGFVCLKLFCASSCIYYIYIYISWNRAGEIRGGFLVEYILVTWKTQPLLSVNFHQLYQLPNKMALSYVQGWFQGPQYWDPFMVSFPYYSHIFRDMGNLP